MLWKNGPTTQNVKHESEIALKEKETKSHATIGPSK